MLHLRYDSAGPAGTRRGTFSSPRTVQIAGYAYLDPPSAEGEGGVTGELVIHPERAAAGTRPRADR